MYMKLLLEFGRIIRDYKMRAGRYGRISSPVILNIIDPAELFQIIELRIVIIPVIVSEHDIKKILLICDGDRIIILVSFRCSSHMCARHNSACDKDR